MGKESVRGKVELLDALKAIAQIRALVSQQAIDGIVACADNPEEVVTRIEQLFGEVRKAIELMGSDFKLFELLGEALSELEYVLPPELFEIHPVLVENLTSEKNISDLPYSGLLLYGIHGTGKTEYPRFLAGVVPPEKVCFVTADISSIRNSAQPGKDLMRLYRQLDQKALEEDVFYVVLFDEFDKLISKFSKVYSTQRSSSSSHGKASSASHETSTSTEVDDTGEELFSTLKTILSGTGGIKRVFSICTSNQTSLPNELLRPGRLQPVRLNTFGMTDFRSNALFEIGGTPFPDYKSYASTIPRVVQVMQATHYRTHREPNPVLSRISDELDELFSDQGKNFKTSGNMRCLEILFEYFGFDINSNTGQVFASYWGGLDHYASNAIRYPEVAFMRLQCTCANLAGFYKQNESSFADYDSAKDQLAKIILPQIVNFNKVEASSS